MSPNPEILPPRARLPDDAELLERTIVTPIGTLRLVASASGLVALLWPGERDGRVPLFPTRDGDAGVLDEAAAQLTAYFAGTRKRFDLPLDPRGTPFQRDVWSALTAIPFGETRSYRDIAVAIGRPSATRAVGAANGRNPIAIIVPCHRVIGATGALTGFAGGLATKERLLALEGARLV